MDKKHVLIVLFALVFTVLVIVGIQIPALNLSQLSRSDSSSAQQGCNGTAFDITTQAPGHTFSKQCVQQNAQIYANDPRFTFHDVANGILPRDFTYIQTDNVAAKNDRNLNWSITLKADANVYVFYRRRIAPTAVPAWLDNDFTSNTAAHPVDLQSLNHYLLRKNSSNAKIGVYDAYFAQRSAGSVINFGPASDNNSTALSMYIVVVIPQLITLPTSDPTSSVAPTCVPGIDCNNDGTFIPTNSPTPTPSRTPSPTPSRTPSPTPTNTPDPTVQPTTTPGPGAQETAVYLQTQGNSGQSGYAVITEMSANQTRVSLSLFGGNYTAQPAHIHSGTCASPGGIIYNLNSVDGTSITYLNVPYTTVINSLGIVNIHKSAADATQTACGTK